MNVRRQLKTMNGTEYMILEEGVSEEGVSSQALTGNIRIYKSDKNDPHTPLENPDNQVLSMTPREWDEFIGR